jgi:hypothetical protein
MTQSAYNKFPTDVVFKWVASCSMQYMFNDAL